MLYNVCVTRANPRGRRTRAAILRTAADLASVQGLEGLTIGALAETLKMSKSGLYAHFGSKEELQLATVEVARLIYVEEVISPALAVESGLGRLLALCERFLSYVERGVFPGGCFFAAAMAEFDCKPGRVRDTVADLQAAWLDTLGGAALSAVATHELSKRTDTSQLAFDLESALLSANWYLHLFSDSSYLARARMAIQLRIRQDATEKGRGRLTAAFQV